MVSTKTTELSKFLLTEMIRTSNFERQVADEISLILQRRSLSKHPVSRDFSASLIPVMPGMYTPQSHLPLTPPEYLQPFNGCNGGIQLNAHQFAMSSQGLSMSEKGPVYDYSVDSYGRKQMHSYPPAHGQSYPVAQPQVSYSGLPPPGLTHPAGRYFSVSGMPVPLPLPPQRRDLPPLDDNYHHQRVESRKQEQPIRQSEEKPVGGVSAHLDYDMEEMTEFVGVMAQQLCVPLGSLPSDCASDANVDISVFQRSISDRALPPSFRKFVLQILSSTRLPSSTILLGLVYLRERMALPAPTTSARHDHVYRMITIALLLASKFLDDNTFQNKSWSEVTGLPVAELNSLEKEWLMDIGWHLHVDPEGTKGFSQYKTMWDTWVRKNGPKAAIPALAPINANIRHNRSESVAFSPAPLYPSIQTYSHQHVNASDPSLQLPRPHHSHPSHESAYWYMSSGEHSPPSAPETGPTTPDGYSFGWSGPFGPQASMPHHRPQGYSRLPPISSSYHHTWVGGPACACSSCQVPESYSLINFCQPVAA